MKLAKITTIDDASLFFKNYIIKLNDEFAIQTNNNINVFDNHPSEELLNFILSVLLERTIDADHSIK